MRLTKSLPRTTVETFTFLKQTDITGLIRLLAEHRGHHNARDRFYRLLYSCLIFDHYSDVYRRQNPVNGIASGWYQLADLPDVGRIYRELLPITDESVIGDITLTLPITSASPLFQNSAPRSPPALPQGECTVRQLTARQFIEVCWVVRCNLLHGSYDPTVQEVSTLIRNVSRPFSALVWRMICETPMR